MKLEKKRWTDLIWSLNIILLCLWLIVYNCANNEYAALYIIVASFVLSMGTVMYAMKKKTEMGLLLLPYTGWLFFATLLSFWNFNKE